MFNCIEGKWEAVQSITEKLRPHLFHFTAHSGSIARVRSIFVECPTRSEFERSFIARDNSLRTRHSVTSIWSGIVDSQTAILVSYYTLKYIFSLTLWYKVRSHGYAFNYSSVRYGKSPCKNEIMLLFFSQIYCLRISLSSWLGQDLQGTWFLELRSYQLCNRYQSVPHVKLCSGNLGYICSCLLALCLKSENVIVCKSPTSVLTSPLTRYRHRRDVLPLL